MSVERDLAQFVTQTRYDHLPKYVVEATKKDVIDTLGAALAGSSALGVKEVVQMLGDLEGAGKCDIFVYDRKVSPQSAALANATMAHALDFDDTLDLAGVHAGVMVVPAALAAAQYIGKVSGKDFITAIVLGIEIEARMALATKPWIGWMLTPLYGYFGVATTVGKLIGLNDKGILDAWGIAYAQAAGNQECVRSGSLSKRIQAGFAASGGVLAALMAAKGITGASESMEGKYGVFNLYQRGDYDRNTLTANLGKTFEVARLSFKPYPCCRFLHAPIDAALKLVQEHDIASKEIDEVVVEVSQRAYDELCVPTEIKHEPRTIVDAQFSIPYGVATALTKRRVVIDNFTERSIRDNDVLLTLSKLHCKADPEISKRAWKASQPCRLTVKASGQIYSTTVDIAKGHPKNPMSDAEIESKFRDCANHSVRPLPAMSISRIIDHIGKLEELANVVGQLEIV